MNYKKISSTFLVLLTSFLLSCAQVGVTNRYPAQSADTSSVTLSKEALSAKEEFPEKVQKFLEWEFHANTADDPTKRHEQFFRVEHYNIPTELVDQDIADSLDPKIRKSLIFVEDGVEYIRWIVNPEDTHFHGKLKSFLESKGLDAKSKSLFAGSLTSSRSIILADKDTGAVFSLKVGTNKTGGDWQDKGVNKNQVVKARVATTIQENIENAFNLKELKVQPETIGGTIKELGQGYIVRELGEDFASGKNYYLPGFSAMNNKVGAEIAKINGSDDPAQFWSKHYHEQLGKASGEMFAFFGLSFTSAHSQQYVIELDENFKPTGKIIFRDIADSSGFKSFFTQHNIDNIEEIWLSDHFKNKPWVASGTLHGMSAPEWVDKKKYKMMNKKFFKAFEKKVSEITNIPLKLLQKGKMKTSDYGYYDYTYYDKTFVDDADKWAHFIEFAPCYQGQKVTKDGKDCEEALSHLPNKYKKVVNITSKGLPTNKCTETLVKVLAN